MVEDRRTGRVTGPGYLVTGRYRLISKIGSGAMGAVWLARDELLGREVAVKQVLSTTGMDAGQAEEQRQRALREGRIAARLTHPHAIAMYDMALDSGEPWLVMEHLPSQSLAEVITASGPLPPPQVAQIGAQVADALAAAHEAGVVHRDVKPGNILISTDQRTRGTVKITDFGISRARGDVTVTRTGVITGTPAYFAPEVARGAEPSETSDVFSLGSTLYTAVEGGPPFGLSDNAIELLHTVARGEVEPPQRAGPVTPVLLQMLEPDPVRRPTMVQVRDELARVAAGARGSTAAVLTTPTTVLPPWAGQTGAPGVAPDRTLAGLPAAAPSPPPGPNTPPPPQRPNHRSRRPWIAATVVLLLLLGTVAVVLATSRREPPQASAVDTTSDPASSPAPAPSTEPPASSTAPPSSATPQTTTPEPTTPETTTTQPTTPETTTTQPTTPESNTPPRPTPAAVGARDTERAVRDYYDLLPDSTEQAYALLGPSLAGQGYQNYAGFWSGMQAVNVSDVRGADNSGVVTLQVVFETNDGRTVTEEHSLQLITAEDGTLLINTDELLSSRTAFGGG